MRPSSANSPIEKNISPGMASAANVNCAPDRFGMRVASGPLGGPVPGMPYSQSETSTADPADDGDPHERVGHPLAGRLAVASGDDRERLVHPPADDQGGKLAVQQHQREATLGRRSEQPRQRDVGGEDQERQPEPGDDRDERVAQER